jgi:hypothetical protein
VRDQHGEHRVEVCAVIREVVIKEYNLRVQPSKAEKRAGIDRVVNGLAQRVRWRRVLCGNGLTGLSPAW